VNTRPWSSSAAIVAALLAASSVHPQVSVSADATAATVHYDGFLRSGVMLLTPHVRVDGSSYSLAGRGTFSRFESGNTSLDLILSGSVFTPPWNTVQVELLGDAGIARYLEVNTGYGSAGVRVHRTGIAAGQWIGASAVTVSDDMLESGSMRADAGAWLRRGPFAMSLSAKLTDVGDIAYTDVTTLVRWSGHWLELSAGGGVRGGDDIGTATRWGDITATAWLSRRVALVAGHGAYPFDLAQRAPGGRYSALSLRVATRPPRLADALARNVRSPMPTTVRPVVAAFETRRNRDGTVRFRVRAPGASRVEIAGDFTDWETVSLVRARGETWEGNIPLSRGTHRFNVRVDGGTWGVPPGVGTTDDDFGGVVGLLVVS
jgi:hypothetical protein